MAFRLTVVWFFPRDGFSPNGGIAFFRAMSFRVTGVSLFPRYGFSLRCTTRHCFLGFSLAAPPHGFFCMVFAPPHGFFCMVFAPPHGLCFSRPNCRVHYVVSVSRNAPHMALSQRDARFILAFNAKNTRVLYVYRGALHYAAFCSRSKKCTCALRPEATINRHISVRIFSYAWRRNAALFRHKTHRPIGITGMRSRLENGRTGMQDKTRGSARF